LQSPQNDHLPVTPSSSGAAKGPLDGAPSSPLAQPLITSPPQSVGSVTNQSTRSPPPSSLALNNNVAKARLASLRPVKKPAKSPPVSQQRGMMLRSSATPSTKPEKPAKPPARDPDPRPGRK
jgi:hypothetical protein